MSLQITGASTCLWVLFLVGVARSHRQELNESQQAGGWLTMNRQGPWEPDTEPNDPSGPTPEEFLQATMWYAEHVMPTLPSMEQFVDLSLEEQSRYADPISIRHSKYPEFTERQQPGREREIIYDQTTQCSIANSAYLALHGHPESVRAAYAESARRMVAYHKEHPATRSSLWEILFTAVFVSVVIYFLARVFQFP